MANYIDIKSGFNVQTASAIDKRILLTKAQMLTIEDECLMPDKYFAICADDGKLYLFDNTSTWSTTTGHFTSVDQVILKDPNWIEQALSESAKFTTLETKVGDAEQGTGIAGQVVELQSDVQELRTDVDELDARVEELKEEVEDPESGLAARIAQLEVRASAAEQRMTEIEERIAAIKLENIPGTISGEEITM